MIESLFPSAPLLAAFLAATLVLVLMPGPAVLYIVARTAAHGRRAGFVSVAGVALGNLGNAGAAALGLAALFAVSSLAFTIVKFAGAAYLVYLAWRALAARAPGAGARGPTPRTLPGMFRDGFLVALLNPKTTLFFAAFLPQFIVPGAGAPAQSLALGALFSLVAALTDAGYVLLASLAAARLSGLSGLSRGLRIGRWSVAAVYLGLGVYAALSGSRPAR